MEELLVARFLVALGVPGVGVAISDTLLEVVDSAPIWIVNTGSLAAGRHWVVVEKIGARFVVLDSLSTQTPSVQRLITMLNGIYLSSNVQKHDESCASWSLLAATYEHELRALRVAHGPRGCVRRECAVASRFSEWRLQQGVSKSCLPLWEVHQ